MNQQHCLKHEESDTRRGSDAESNETTEQRLHALLAVTDTALTSLRLDDLLLALLARVREVMGVDNAVILLLDEDRRNLLVRAARGLEEEVASGVRVPFGQGMAGTVAATRKTLIANDLSKIAVHSPFLREKIRSLVAVPLVTNDRTIGVLHMGTAYLHHFTDDDARFLERVGERAALAIERAQLYEAESRARDEVTARASQLEAVFEAMTDGVVLEDADGAVLRLNSAARQLFGVHVQPNSPSWPAERRSVAMQYRDIHGQSVPLDETPMYRVLRGETLAGPTAIDVSMRMLDGLERMISFTGAPTRDSAGAVTGGVGVWRDVTDRRQLEQELRTRERQFRATFEQAAVGIAHVAIDGRWLLVNQRLCDIVGYTHEELLSRTFQDITYPADLEADIVYLQELLQDVRSTYSMEKRYICKDGELIWVNLTVSLIRSASGDPEYLISVIEDISQRKRVEEQVRVLNATLERRVEERTTQLQEANQQLEAFSYSVSHDLRAPLRAMQGFAQALYEDYGDELDDAGKLYLQRIVANVAGMDSLIQDLLAYSRLSRENIHLHPVPLIAVIQRALALVEAPMNERHADVVVDDRLPVVVGESTILTQVIANLISNAITFVAPGTAPHVRLWTEEYFVDDAAGEHENTESHEQRWARLWVEDNGLGIDPEHQERIFRVFERLHGIEMYPGTGIGLAIVRKGMERMGGRSGVISRLGEGSRFWIELPLATERRSDHDDQ